MKRLLRSFIIGSMDCPELGTRSPLDVRYWHNSEVPPAATEGRLRLQSGLWHGHPIVYEFTALASSAMGARTSKPYSAAEAVSQAQKLPA